MQKERRQAEVEALTASGAGPRDGIGTQDPYGPAHAGEICSSRRTHQIMLIEKDDIPAGPPLVQGAQQAQEQRSVARAELDDPPRRRMKVQAGDRAQEDRTRAHRAMDTLQIAPRSAGTRIIGRQAVQTLGANYA